MVNVRRPSPPLPPASTPWPINVREILRSGLVSGTFFRLRNVNISRSKTMDLRTKAQANKASLSHIMFSLILAIVNVRWVLETDVVAKSHCAM